MQRPIPGLILVVVLAVTLPLSVLAPAARAASSPDARPAAARGDLDPIPVPPPSASDRLEVQVLLSSIDMTVSLIDAYGSCREEERSHEDCMVMIRSTLDHARRMIGNE